MGFSLGNPGEFGLLGRGAERKQTNIAAVDIAVVFIFDFEIVFIFLFVVQFI